MKTNRKDLILSITIGLMIVLISFTLSAERGFTLVHRLSDGCFTAGVLLCGIGGIFFCANKGAFNLLGFSASRALKVITGFGKDPAEDEHDAYYNYCVAQSEKGEKPFAHLLIGGAMFIVAAVVFLIIYLMMG